MQVVSPTIERRQWDFLQGEETHPIIKAAAVLIHFPSPNGFLLGILDTGKLNVTSCGGGGGGAEADRVDIGFDMGLLEVRHAEGAFECAGG